jgi:flagellum-specific peptidoglycan hydrolase FlgJ
MPYQDPPQGASRYLSLPGVNKEKAMQWFSLGITEPQTYNQARLLAEAVGYSPEQSKVVAGQWQFESGGGSKIPSAYNYFGIKAHNEAVRNRLKERGLEVGVGKDAETTAGPAKFMEFNNAFEGFAAHKAFLETNKRYAKALAASTAKDFAFGLSDAGYADKDYGNKLYNQYVAPKEKNPKSGDVRPKSFGPTRSSKIKPVAPVTTQGITGQDVVTAEEIQNLPLMAPQQIDFSTPVDKNPTQVKAMEDFEPYKQKVKPTESITFDAPKGWFGSGKTMFAMGGNLYQDGGPKKTVKAAGYQDLKNPNALRLEYAPASYNYSDYINSLGYNVSLKKPNLNRPAPGDQKLVIPASLKFYQDYTDNAEAYAKDPSRFEIEGEYARNRNLPGSPYEKYNRGIRPKEIGIEGRIGVASKLGDTNAAYGAGGEGYGDAILGYSQNRGFYMGAEPGIKVHFNKKDPGRARGNLHGYVGGSFPFTFQTKPAYSSLRTYAPTVSLEELNSGEVIENAQERIIPGEGSAGRMGPKVSGQIDYTQSKGPLAGLNIGGRASALFDISTGKHVYAHPDRAISQAVAHTDSDTDVRGMRTQPYINAEVFANYPLSAAAKKVSRGVGNVAENVAKSSLFDSFRGIPKPEFYLTKPEFGKHPEEAKDTPRYYLPGYIPESGRTFTSAEESERYYQMTPIPFLAPQSNFETLENPTYKQGGAMNFKSKGAYQKWLGYGHASGEFAKTPGNQKVSIQGEPHKVEHQYGGQMYADGGALYDSMGNFYPDGGYANTVGQAAQYGSMGYQAGSQFGPWGGIIGGLAGSIIGGVQGNQQDQAIAEEEQKLADQQARQDYQVNQSGMAVNQEQTNQLNPNNPTVFMPSMQYAMGGSFNNKGFRSLPTAVQNKIKSNSFAQGGTMDQLTEFNGGFKHDDPNILNSNSGIPQGMAPNGVPNIVERGETKDKEENYIFSDNIKVTKEIAQEFNLPSNYVNKTFSEASKTANRSHSRRENDTIESNDTKRNLEKLTAAQEATKELELQKDIAMMQQKHPDFMNTLMAQQQSYQPMGTPGGQMMEAQVPGEMMSGPQGMPIDPNQLPPEMLAQMPEAQQGMPVMAYGGHMYKCGGKMYNFGGRMYDNGGTVSTGGTTAVDGGDILMIDNPADTSTPNLGAQMGGAAAGLAGTLGSGLTSGGSPEDVLNSTVNQGLSMIPGYGAIHGVTNMAQQGIRSNLGDYNVNPITGEVSDTKTFKNEGEAFLDAWVKPQHEYITEGIAEGDLGKTAMATLLPGFSQIMQIQDSNIGPVNKGIVTPKVNTSGRAVDQIATEQMPPEEAPLYMKYGGYVAQSPNHKFEQITPMYKDNAGPQGQPLTNLYGMGGNMYSMGGRYLVNGGPGQPELAFIPPTTSQMEAEMYDDPYAQDFDWQGDWSPIMQEISDREIAQRENDAKNAARDRILFNDSLFLPEIKEETTNEMRIRGIESPGEYNPQSFYPLQFLEEEEEDKGNKGNKSNKGKTSEEKDPRDLRTHETLASTVANMLPGAYNLYQALQPLDNVTPEDLYTKYSPEKVNYTQAENEARENYARMVNAAGQLGLSGGSRMGSLLAAAQQYDKEKGRILSEEENINKQLENQARQMNAQQRTAAQKQAMDVNWKMRTARQEHVKELASMAKNYFDAERANEIAEKYVAMSAPDLIGEDKWQVGHQGFLEYLKAEKAKEKNSKKS